MGYFLCFFAVPVVFSAEKPTTGILLVSGNDLPLAVLPPNLYDLVDVALAYSTNHALAKDGTLYAWTTVDDLRVVMSDCVGVTAGSCDLLTVRKNGSVSLWHSTAPEVRLFQGIKIQSLAPLPLSPNASSDCSSAVAYHAVAENGLAYEFQSSSRITTQISGLTNVAAIAARANRTLESLVVLTRDGRVLARSDDGAVTEPWVGVTNAISVVNSDSGIHVALDEGTLLSKLFYSALSPLYLTNRFASRIQKVFAPNPSFGDALRVTLEDGRWMESFSSGSSEWRANLSYMNIGAFAYRARDLSFVGVDPPYPTRSLYLVNVPAEPPRILTQSTNRIGRVGHPAVLDAVVHSVRPVSFGWLKNGQPFTTQTNAPLRFDSLSAQSDGTYQLIACNPFGCSTSAPIRLTLTSEAGPFVLESNNLGDGGQASLRELVHDANALGGATIVLTNLQGVVQLTRSLPVIERDLSMVGSGTNKLQLQGGLQGRGLTILSGVNCALSGISFNGFGDEESQAGGVIWNAGKLLVENCVFVTNRAAGRGGAIWNGGALQMKGCLLLSNTVTYVDSVRDAFGGALMSESGTVSLDACAFLGNRALASDGTVRSVSTFGGINLFGSPGGFARGGALCSLGSTTSVSRCSFLGNIAEGGNGGVNGEGGAVWVGSGEFRADKCVWLSNGAYGHYRYSILAGGKAFGGGLCVSTGKVVVSSSSFVGNLAAPGSADRIGLDQHGDSGLGGAIALIHQDGTFNLVNSTVSSNRTEAAYSSNTESAYGTSPPSCTILFAGSSSGAGIYVSEGTATMTHCTIVNNSSNAKQGGYSQCPGPIDTLGYGKGAGLRNVSGVIHLANSIVAGNSGSPSVVDRDVSGEILSNGGNLIGTTNGLRGLASGDLWNLDPKLAPLKDNGGATPTHALLPESPALDRASQDWAAPTDQRGFNRIGPPDIGAYELQTANPHLAPRIPLANSDQSVEVSTPLLIRGIAVGTQPLSYQWLKDGVELPGANSAFLSTDRATAAQAGTYRLRVSNAYGSVLSASIKVTVRVPDAINYWIEDVAPELAGFVPSGIVYGSGRFVACGENSAPAEKGCLIATSADGVRWTLSCIATNPGNQLFAIAHHQGRFVAVGPRRIVVSTNGVDWKVVSTNIQAVASDFYGGLRVQGGDPGFIVQTPGSGGYWQSENLWDWMSLAVPASIYTSAIGYINGRFRTLGSFETYSSANGKDWEKEATSTSPSSFDSQGVLLAEGGVTCRTRLSYKDIGFRHSKDGVNWEFRGSTTNQVHLLAYGAGQYVATERIYNTHEDYFLPIPLQRIFSSPNADQWMLRYSKPLQSIELTTGTFGDGRFLFLGSRGGQTLRSVNFDLPNIILRTVGSGSIDVLTPNSERALGKPVRLLAKPGRWHRFDRWDDWVATPERADVLSAVNDFMAIFAPTTRLETITIGSASRTAPLGMPAILADGQLVTSTNVSNLREISITVTSTLPHAAIAWSIDGSGPGLSCPAQPRQFVLRRSAVLRTKSFPSDGSAPIEADPVTLTILPAYRVSTSTPGGGSVRLIPFLALVPESTEVTVQATADIGWRFLQWDGDVTGSNQNLVLRPQSDLKIEGIFATTPPTQASSGGVVSVAPASVEYPYGYPVQLTAIPNPGFAFAGWNTPEQDLANPLTWIVRSPDPFPTAQFQALKAGSFAMITRLDGWGKITQVPLGGSFPNGTSITLQAIPGPDQEFLGWTGGITNSAPEVTVVLRKNLDVTARFSRRSSLAIRLIDDHVQPLAAELILRGPPDAVHTIEFSTNEVWMPLQTLTNSLVPKRLRDPIDLSVPRRFYR